MIIPTSKEMYIRNLDPEFSKPGVYTEIARLDEEERLTQEDTSNRYEVLCKEAEKTYFYVKDTYHFSKILISTIPVFGGLSFGVFATSSLAFGPVGVAAASLFGVGTAFMACKKWLYPVTCPDSIPKCYFQVVNKILKDNNVNGYRLERIRGKLETLKTLAPTAEKDKSQKDKAILLLEKHMKQISERNEKLIRSDLLPDSIPFISYDGGDVYRPVDVHAFRNFAASKGFECLTKEELNQIDENVTKKVREYNTSIRETLTGVKEDEKNKNKPLESYYEDEDYMSYENVVTYKTNYITGMREKDSYRVPVIKTKTFRKFRYAS